VLVLAPSVWCIYITDARSTCLQARHRSLLLLLAACRRCRSTRSLHTAGPNRQRVVVLALSVWCT
jgi:hypothetical protein